MSNAPVTGTALEASAASSPATIYAQRLNERKTAVIAFERRDLGISYIRVALFAVFLLGLWLVFGARVVSSSALWVPPILFVVLILVHERVVRQKARAERAADHYRRGLDRLEDRWVGVGTPGLDLLDVEHPYAVDLDLFGVGSLFERMNLARTRTGQRHLARWMTETPSRSETDERRAAVDELTPDLDLREGMFLLGHEFEREADSEALRDALGSPVEGLSGVEKVLASVLTFGLLAAIGLWWGAWTTGTPLLFVIFLQIGFRLRVQKRSEAQAAGIDNLGPDLRLLGDLLQTVEGRSFQSPLLQRLSAVLESAGRRPSRAVKGLERRLDLYEARRNAMFAPVTFLTLWDIHTAEAVGSWRRQHGGAVERWLEAVGEFEAISSVAGYAFECPDDVFAERGTTSGFSAEYLGHPLLPRDTCIRNDVDLGAHSPLWVVSGSNMSGKSTFLRTVGISVVLTQMGAPVRARRLTVSPIQLASSIRIQDSMQAGVSHFYAEIRRLRMIADQTEKERPVLFLVDEILQGTNSHDRQIGVEAFLKNLLARNAIGMVTTHDLALTEMVDRLTGARNVHFQDHLEDDKMVFDYQLRSGRVEKSNALELMRSVGLDV